MAAAMVRWRSVDEGGRRFGPPGGSFFAATAVFADKGRGESKEWPTRTDTWPALGEHFSVLLEIEDHPWGQIENANVDFIAPELVRLKLRLGVRFYIMEGRNPVAEATVTRVLT